MQLHLHNTLSGQREAFVPLDPDRVTVYVCGPTVYNLVHIGNGRPAVVFDVLVRLLRRLHKTVVYVRNITDVDDKINAAAASEHRPIAELTDEFTAEYVSDIHALGVAEPDVEPRATHHIPEIITMIGELISAGHAYEAEGHVLFNVPSDPNYGALSKRSLDDMIAGARVDVAPYKQHPADFVLWKPSSDDLPGWDSPWGRGRPGWHIECSAMIRKHLGEQIDIHGGGSDLVFPHHENELAQSTCANHADTPQGYVRYWLHNGMLTLGNEKMSKSVGNIFTIRSLLANNNGEVLRYALLSAQYRSPLAWSDDLLEQSTTSLSRLYTALQTAGLGNARSSDSSYAHVPLAELPEAFLQPLLDDLNTPRALAALHALAGDINRTDDHGQQQRLGTRLLACANLLGLLERSAEAHFRGEGLGDGLGDSQGTGLAVADIDALITQRSAARHERNWARADQIRDQLLAEGIELEDAAGNTTWKRTL